MSTPIMGARTAPPPIHSPRRRARAVLLFAFLVASACGAPRRATIPPPTGEQIAVVGFDVAGATSSYDGRVEELGSRLASETANELFHGGLTAEAVPAGATPGGSLVVRGRIIRVEGGSRALRFWIGLGAGAARVVAEGTVSRSDGTVLASFRDGRSASGEPELGLATEARLVDKCLRAVGADIAEMIATGQYREEPL